MAIGDITPVVGADGVYYVDTGMYDTEAYGSVYLIDAERPAIVDSGIGTNYERILAGLETIGIDPTELSFVLLTHVHLDHAGGAGRLLEACPNATVLCHDFGVRHLIDPERLIQGTKDAVEDQWQYYTEPKPIPEDRIEGLTDGDAVGLGDRAVDVHHAPGHAPHQVLFHDTTDDLLFTGDAAGIYVPSRDQVVQTSPPSNFDLEACLDDVRTIEQLAPERLCFGHFGDRAFDAELAERYKRTLVEWVEAIRQKRAELASDEAVLKHFVENARLRGPWGDEKAEAETRLNARGVLGYLRRREDDAGN
jgi:glyoxylase-like metal-dependent hydrolase (beta-lactamase superfamily II)